MVLKLCGLGFKDYIRDHYNKFDAILVIVSIIEMTFEFVGGIHMSSGAFTVMRGFRLLRVVKLARSWTTFRNLLRWLASTFSQTGVFLVLLLLFIFIFMLIGMELFAYKVKYDDSGMPVQYDAEGHAKSAGQSMRANFDYPGRALTTIFIVAVGDDWNAIMYGYYRAFHNWSKV